MTAERRLLVAGPRSWTDVSLIHHVLDAALAILQTPFIRQDRLTLVHGGMTGLDSLAAQAASSRGWRVGGWPARWGQYTTACPCWHLTPTSMGTCRMAEHRRQEEIAALNADLVITFPVDSEVSDSASGTWSLIRATVKAGLPTLILWDCSLRPCGTAAERLLAAPRLKRIPALQAS